MSATVAGTSIRPNRSYTNPRDVTVWAAGRTVRAALGLPHRPSRAGF
jgi:hypothetical protein